MEYKENLKAEEAQESTGAAKESGTKELSEEDLQKVAGGALGSRDTWSGPKIP